MRKVEPAMSLHLPQFFRNTPQEMLKNYLNAVNAQAFEAIDWESKSRARGAVLLAAVDLLDEPSRLELYGDVERILQFKGRKAGASRRTF